MYVWGLFGIGKSTGAARADGDARVDVPCSMCSFVLQLPVDIMLWHQQCCLAGFQCDGVHTSGRTPHAVVRVWDAGLVQYDAVAAQLYAGSSHKPVHSTLVGITAHYLVWF
jgi:hypothetical protein